MDELGFRGTNNDALSVSYIPVVSSPASRKAATSSRSNLGVAQFSRLSSPRVPSTGNSLSSLLSRPSGKRSMSPTAASLGSNTSIPKFRTLRNMLSFGPKQPSSSAASSASSSRKSSSPPVSFTAAKPADLKHRRSSSSIPTPLGSAIVPKHGFMSVGRRTSLSLSQEKTLPLPPPMHRSRSEDLGSLQSSVISIAPPSASTSKLNVTQRGLPLPDDPFKKSSPNVVVSNAFQKGPSREDVGTVRSGGDLSTIIESELSNLSISKHLKPLDAFEEEDHKAQEKGEKGEDADNESDTNMLAQLAQQEDNNNLSIMHAQDMDVTSATADLSASWEAGLADFRRTLKLCVPGDRRSADGRSSSSTYFVSPVSFPSSTQDPAPPNSTSSNSKSEVQLSPKEFDQEGEQVSFNLTALDPDLAALLNSNNLPARLEGDASAAIVAAVDSVTPPPPMHSSASPSPEPEEPNRRTSFDADNIWLTAASSRRTSVDSRRRTVGLQSSPVRRSRPSSLALSSDSLPLADRTRGTSLETTPMNKNVHRPLLSPTPRPEFTSPRTSIEDLTDTVRRPSLSRPVASDDSSKHRTSATRLYATPSRPSMAGSVQGGRVFSDSGRPFLRSSQAREELTSGLYSPASYSRSATSLGMSARTRRTMGVDTIERPGTALSSIGRGPPPLPQRSRKRSMSVTTDSRVQNRAAPDWMGPRTARAFAAAGLLDSDTNRAREHDLPPPIPPRAESRMHLGASRVSAEREYRLNGGPPSGSAGTISTPSLHVPSRVGYSEHGHSPSGSRRRTASRTMTMAELASARGESPVTTATSSSISKTVFSASTATSLSCSSPHQQNQAAHLESTISSLKEKHASDMEALLSALADSQRTSKTLREENTHLHGRIRDLEDQLGELAEQLDNACRFSPQPPMPNSFTRTLLHHQRSSPRTSPSRMHTFLRSPAASLADDFDPADAHITVREPGALLSPSFAALESREHRARKRASTASSVFPVMPSNMSMLLHDEGSDTNPSGGLAFFQSHAYASSSGSPPASPTLNVNRLVTPSIPIERNRHVTKLSLSSIDMSMLSSLPGSPESLQLKPEHEKHLCDMKSLDFSVMDSD